MTTERLYEFLVLSKVLNYSQAAQSLYITQSVLTKHIQELEKELETQLFSRTTHEVVLTSAGRRLAEEASSIINHCDDALHMLQSQDIATDGIIRIGCVLEFSYAAHIQVFISRFMERYPGIDIDFEVCSNGTPAETLSSYDILFTPCEYHHIPNNIHQHLINNHETYAALPPGHRLLSKSLLTLRELAGETIIVPFADELFGPYTKNWMLIKKYTHDNVNCIQTSNLHSALFLVSIGKGIAIVPRYAKKLVPFNTFIVGLSNSAARFPEYMYYNENDANGAAKLFYNEYCSSLLKNS